MLKIYCAAILAAALFASFPAASQDKSADNMQILLEKVRADKKLLVATNMNLTETEAEGFWPLYDAYQKDLQQINRRIEKMIKSYADAYSKGTVPAETAKQLLQEALAIEESELQLKRSFVPKLEKVVPVPKVARYLQIENKVRSAVKYDLARKIPLVQ